MAYDGSSGLYTVFPSPGGKGSASSSSSSPTRSSTRTARPKKGKPPCAYGPRVNGRCPKKPRAALASAGLVGAEFPEQPRSKSGKSAGSSLFEKVAVGTGKSTAQAVVHQLVPKITPRLSGKMIRAQARAAVTGTKQNISEGVLLAASRSKAILAKLAAPVGALTGTTVALALGAGLAAYAATTAVLNHIKDAKERAQQARFEAAQAYRKSRLEAERLAGRPLTADEQKMLSAKFKEALDNL